MLQMASMQIAGIPMSEGQELPESPPNGWGDLEICRRRAILPASFGLMAEMLDHIVIVMVM